MKRYWLVALAVTALAVACGGSDDTSALRAQVAALQTQVAPDRVVGIEWRCTFRNSDGKTEDLRGAGMCLAAEGGVDHRPYPGVANAQLLNRRQELTVRTSTGTSYTANVSPSTKVAINDEWPPK